MELKEFISKTLLDVYEGIREANEFVKKISGEEARTFGLPSHNQDDFIEFDVAITIASGPNDNAPGKIEVKVPRDGAEQDTPSQLENVSRIKFKIKTNKNSH